MTVGGAGDEGRAAGEPGGRPVIASQRQYIEIYASFVTSIEPGGGCGA